jgi:heme/copper-type cytochrome/quinol oxidase subunit 3
LPSFKALITSSGVNAACSAAVKTRSLRGKGIGVVCTVSFAAVFLFSERLLQEKNIGANARADKQVEKILFFIIMEFGFENIFVKD